MRTLWLIALLSALGACTVTLGPQDQKVNVDCVGTAEDIKCEVKHTQGEVRVKACWELHFECVNGTKPQGSGCQEIGPGETKEHRIPLSQLKDAEKCDKVSKTELKNLTLTGL